MVEINPQIRTEIVKPKISNQEREVKKLNLTKVSELRKKGKSIKEIGASTGFSPYIVKKLLIKSGEKGLIPKVWRYKKPLTKEQVISKFNKWFLKFARELKAGSPQELSIMNSDALKTYLSMLEGLSQPSHLREMLMSVFVYSFFRAKGFNTTYSLLKKLSGLTRHEYFSMLKRIDGTFSECTTRTTRDRKHVILGKLYEIKDHFKLNTQFFEYAGKILQKLWGILGDTTDGIIVGTVSALSLIALHIYSPPLRNICQKIGISQSAVIYQVKKIVKRLGIFGFTTLRQSRELLHCEVLEKVVGIQLDFFDDRGVVATIPNAIF